MMDWREIVGVWPVPVAVADLAPDEDIASSSGAKSWSA
jgi:hypothetical protein